MGEEIRISIDQLHARTEHYVRAAAEQQRVIITDDNEPVAELQPTKPAAEWVNPWKTRKLLPGFQKSEELGAFRWKPGDRDVTDLISDDRDGN
jgi:prevent-host-death family protein